MYGAPDMTSKEEKNNLWPQISVSWSDVMSGAPYVRGKIACAPESPEAM